MNRIEDRPTPESTANAFVASVEFRPHKGSLVVPIETARNLERQKAALREALGDVLDCINETRGKTAHDAVLKARATLAATKPTP